MIINTKSKTIWLFIRPIEKLGQIEALALRIEIYVLQHIFYSNPAIRDGQSFLKILRKTSEEARSAMLQYSLTCNCLKTFKKCDIPKP